MSKKKVEKELKESGKNATRVVMFDDMVVEDLKSEEISEVHKEKLDKLVKETVDKLVGEDTKERVFTNIKKLKCDYTTYKEERTKYNMPVKEICNKCGKSFEAGEEIYTADIGTEPLVKQVIICGNCAKGE